MLDGIVGILNLAELLPAPIQIGKHVFHRGAVLLFQPVDHIQTALQPVQLLGREIEVLLKVPQRLRRIVGGIAQGGELLPQLRQLRAQLCHGADGALGFRNQVAGPPAVFTAEQGKLGLLNGLHQLSGTAQHGLACVQFLILAGLQLRTLQLPDLILQRIHPAGPFCLVHLQSGDLPPKRGHRTEGLAILLQQGSGLAKAVQITQMGLRVQQLLAVVLAVDIQKLTAQLPKLSHGDGTPVDPAHIPAVSVELSLQHKLLSRV